jgi:hypothetical protein
MDTPKKRFKIRTRHVRKAVIIACYLMVVVSMVISYTMRGMYQ